MPETYVALLRGINVGGKNKLPMKDLTDLFVVAGGENVRSFIQSGNVMFRAAPEVATVMSGRVSGQIAERFGYRIPVVLRTTEQMRDVAQNNPFLELGSVENSLHVMFLADVPSPDRVAALDPDRSPPDTFVVRGWDIYLRLPGGMANTKLSNSYFDSKLATVSTIRNWRTVTKLLELMGG